MERRQAVREAFEWSWSAYERDAWGSDEVSPADEVYHVAVLRALHSRYILAYFT